MKLHAHRECDTAISNRIRLPGGRVRTAGRLYASRNAGARRTRCVTQSSTKSENFATSTRVNSTMTCTPCALICVANRASAERQLSHSQRRQFSNNSPHKAVKLTRSRRGLWLPSVNCSRELCHCSPLCSCGLAHFPSRRLIRAGEPERSAFLSRCHWRQHQRQRQVAGVEFTRPGCGRCFKGLARLNESSNKRCHAAPLRACRGGFRPLRYEALHSKSPFA